MDLEHTEELASWELAKGIAKVLLPVPPQLREANATLWEAHLESQANGVKPLTPQQLHAIRAMEPIGKLTTPIYFAAMSMYPARVSGLAEDDTLKALVEILQPGLFTTVVTMIYLHRRINKIVADLGSDRATELWGVLAEEMILDMELGYTVGAVIQGLGAAEGLLLGGIRFAGLAALLIMQRRFYENYRGKKRGKIDIQLELSQLKFDHAQISSILLAEFGYAENAVSASAVFRNNDWGGLEPPGHLRAWKAGMDWVEGARRGLVPPKVFLSPDRFQLSDDRITELSERVDSVHERGISFKWMFKSSAGGLMVDAPAEDPLTE